MCGLALAAHIHICTHTHECTHTRAYTHTHTYTIHTYIHTYIHTNLTLPPWAHLRLHPDPHTHTHLHPRLHPDSRSRADNQATSRFGFGLGDEQCFFLCECEDEYECELEGECGGEGVNVFTQSHAYTHTPHIHTSASLFLRLMHTCAHVGKYLGHIEYLAREC